MKSGAGESPPLSQIKKTQQILLCDLEKFQDEGLNLERVQGGAKRENERMAYPSKCCSSADAYVIVNTEPDRRHEVKKASRDSTREQESSKWKRARHQGNGEDNVVAGGWIGERREESIREAEGEIMILASK